MVQFQRRGVSWISGWPARITVLAGLVLFGLQSLSAHRLDEYLQASQITVGTESIDVRVYLTPGVAVTPSLLSTLDPDNDSALSKEEIDRYAQSIVSMLSLKIDGRQLDLRLTSAESASVADLRDGVGSIRVLARATPVAGPGRHALEFNNAFAPPQSVYLANAMVPADTRIAIRSQERNNDQTEITIAYDVSAVDRLQSRSIVIGAVIVGVAAAFVLRQRRLRGRSNAPTA
jgi:hypothetical protein